MSDKNMDIFRCTKGNPYHDNLVGGIVNIPHIGRRGIITDVFTNSDDFDSITTVRCVILWDTDKPWDEAYEENHFDTYEDLAVEEAVQVVDYSSIEDYIGFLPR